MQEERVLEILNLYTEFFKEMGIKPSQYPLDIMSDTKEKCLSHCYSMIPEMKIFLAEGKREKTFRWLGFIQGVLWSYKIYSIMGLMIHNRPVKK